MLKSSHNPTHKEQAKVILNGRKDMKTIKDYVKKIKLQFDLWTNSYLLLKVKKVLSFSQEGVSQNVYFDWNTHFELIVMFFLNFVADTIFSLGQNKCAVLYLSVWWFLIGQIKIYWTIIGCLVLFSLWATIISNLPAEVQAQESDNWLKTQW